MKTLISFLVFLVVSSCAATVPPKREPEKASQNLHNELKAADTQFRAGDSKKAMARIKRILGQAPESDVADDAHLLAAQIYGSAQQHNEALSHYEAILKSVVASPLEGEAGMGAARTLLKLGRAEEAEQLLENSSRWRSVTPEQTAEIERLRYESLVTQKKNLKALAVLVALFDSSPSPSDKEKFRALAVETLESKLSEEEIATVADSSKYGFLRAPAKFRIALGFAEKRQYSRARSLLVDIVDLAPGTELADRANTLVQQIDSRNKVEPRTIGVVLPLSGKQAAVGQKALRGIQLGLGVYGPNQSNFRLAVIDSEGNPDAARRAVERLVLEDSVIAVVGGLLSKTASAEASKAQEFGVPAIMLSQKSGLTQIGDWVFLNALTSQMQMQFLVDTAMNKLGIKSFAIVYPNDAFGVEYANLFWDEVKARGGNIAGAQPYDPKETDFRGHVQRLVGTFYLEDRADEYRVKSKQFAEKNPKKAARQAGPSVEDLLPPVADFEAVFIPDLPKAAGQIAPMFAYNNVTKVRLLGTKLWNNPAIIQRGQKFVENSIFVDSFLPNDPAFVNSQFFANFKTTFNEDPGLTELQAYDSAFLLRQLVASGETTRIGLQQKLASLQNFPGAIGALTVSADREIRRPMTALTVKDGKISGLETIQK